jgi:hypothetical protein
MQYTDAADGSSPPHATRANQLPYHPGIRIWDIAYMQGALLIVAMAFVRYKVWGSQGGIGAQRLRRFAAEE